VRRFPTIGEKYGPAMMISDQAQADAYFEQCVQHSIRCGNSREAAVLIERKNLAYYAGYYDNEVRERIERLYKCAHPVFGPIAKTGTITPEQAFNMGIEWAKKNK
jgi:hypothetical protein